MRIVITGATGNVGTALVRALLADGGDDPEIIGVARRRPDWSPQGVTWRQADIARDDLLPILRGARCRRAPRWLIQPSRDRALTHRVNVSGSQRVFEAAAAAEVPALVHASSVAAYRPADPPVPVDESWPTDGSPGRTTRAEGRRRAPARRARGGAPDQRVARPAPGADLPARERLAGPAALRWPARPRVGGAAVAHPDHPADLIARRQLLQQRRCGRSLSTRGAIRRQRGLQRGDAAAARRRCARPSARRPAGARARRGGARRHRSHLARAAAPGLPGLAGRRARRPGHEHRPGAPGTRVGRPAARRGRRAARTARRTHGTAPASPLPRSRVAPAGTCGGASSAAASAGPPPTTCGRSSCAADASAAAASQLSCARARTT